MVRNTDCDRQYEPELIPVMMMATRSAGMMAHWKEAMCKLFLVRIPSLQND